MSIIYKKGWLTGLMITVGFFANSTSYGMQIIKSTTQHAMVHSTQVAMPKKFCSSAHPEKPDLNAIVEPIKETKNVRYIYKLFTLDDLTAREKFVRSIASKLITISRGIGYANHVGYSAFGPYLLLGMWEERYHATMNYILIYDKVDNWHFICNKKETWIKDCKNEIVHYDDDDGHQYKDLYLMKFLKDLYKWTRNEIKKNKLEQKQKIKISE